MSRTFAICYLLLIQRCNAIQECNAMCKHASSEEHSSACKASAGYREGTATR